MSDYLYFPLVKTRDAELRGMGYLEESCFSKILPIYELTKSRRTLKAPDGDIYRRMKKIEEIQGNRPFILDLSTDPIYRNPQIEQLLSENGGFYEWQVFIFELHSDLNVIPMVHLYEDEDGVIPEVKRFVTEASTKINFLAVRIPYDLQDVAKYLMPIREALRDECKLYVILDANYIREEAKNNVRIVTDTFVQVANEVVDCLGDRLEDVVMVCTSFPSSPAQEAKNNPDVGKDADFAGEFPIFEEEIYKGIVESFPIKYGDYASINTEQIEMRGGTFVPRIDIALNNGNKFIYKRYRRDRGGYQLCAQKMLDDSRYDDIGDSAHQELLQARDHTPTGISPAFWISVRLERYITTRLQLRLQG